MGAATVDRIPDARVKRAGPALADYTPCERGLYFNALRKAVERLWGEVGLAAVSADLAEDTRAAVLQDIPHSEWVPERHLIALNMAIWAGPAARRRDVYQECIELTMALSFGVVRRSLLQLASPRTLLSRSPRLFADDHTHGELEVVSIGERDAVLRLHDHPFVGIPQARAAFTYSLRCIIALCRVEKATETHGLDSEGALRMRLAWE